ncbi:MAG: ABC transporter ATP-binding protein [Lachnospiraceae bacterium]|nr:ABC transporter ATP-binding protein [Lachnospiraceae bacterium]
MAQDTVLTVRDLQKYYKVKSSKLFGEKRYVHAVDEVSFEIKKGETLGLVGESGSGKSTLGRQIVGLEKPDKGEILFNGTQKRGMNTSVQMIFQDPYSSLNPRKYIYDILAAPLLYNKICTKTDVEAKIDELLEAVGLPQSAKNRYPYEFSGGQRQRIMIAKVLSLNPEFIVCDESVSALDVSIQAQILNLLRKLQEERKLTYLFIAHGLGAVRYVSDRIAVMYLGKIVEIADSNTIFRNPIHPYTKMLVESAPIPDPKYRNREIILTEDEIPSAENPPDGCRFHTRCPYATDRCKNECPQLVSVDKDGEEERQVACFRYKEIHA